MGTPVNKAPLLQVAPSRSHVLMPGMRREGRGKQLAAFQRMRPWPSLVMWLLPLDGGPRVVLWELGRLGACWDPVTLGLLSRKKVISGLGTGQGFPPGGFLASVIYVLMPGSA